MIAQLAAAIAFLTRLPVGRNSAFDAKQVGRSARWFPLVGALLGGIYVAALRLLIPFFPALVTAVILIALDAALTGAMHFDGLADTADGFGGGRSREDVLRIMRDHAIGAYGAVALVLLIALKIAAISALSDSRWAVSALLLAPVLGRWSAVLLSATGTYARQDSPVRFVGPTELIIATLTALACGIAAARWQGAAALLLVALATAWWGWRCRRRIGGITGDTLGAGVEMSECLVLLLFTALR